MKQKAENTKMKLDNDIEEGQQMINKLSAQLDMLKDSIERTEDEKKKCEMDLSDVMLKQSIVQGRMTSVAKQTNKLLDDWRNNESENSAEEKSAANMMKKADKLEDIIQEKRDAKQLIVHDLKKIKNDVTNTKIDMEEIQGHINEKSKELKDVENEVRGSEQKHKEN